MFNNIGRKVKGLAKFVCVAGMILSVILGIATMAGGDIAFRVSTNGSRLYQGGGFVAGSGAAIFAGLLIMAIGCLTSWLSSWTTYAIGVAAEEAEKNRSRLEELEKKIDKL